MRTLSNKLTGSKLLCSGLLMIALTALCVFGFRSHGAGPMYKQSESGIAAFHTHRALDASFDARPFPAHPNKDCHFSFRHKFRVNGLFKSPSVPVFEGLKYLSSGPSLNRAIAALAFIARPGNYLFLFRYSLF